MGWYYVSQQPHLWTVPEGRKIVDELWELDFTN